MKKTKRTILTLLMLIAIMPAIMGVHVVFLSCNCNRVEHLDMEVLIGSKDIDICSEDEEECIAGVHCCGDCHAEDTHGHETEACDCHIGSCDMMVNNATVRTEFGSGRSNITLQPTTISLLTDNNNKEIYKEQGLSESLAQKQYALTATGITACEACSILCVYLC